MFSFKHLAARNNHTKILKLLLSQRASASRHSDGILQFQLTKDGSCPLLVASQNGHMDVLELLTEAQKESIEARVTLVKAFNLHHSVGDACVCWFQPSSQQSNVTVHLILCR